MRTVYGYAATCCLAAALCSGCWLSEFFGLPRGKKTPVNPRAQYEETGMLRDNLFEDVPVPMGFQVKPANTFSYQCKGFRFGTFHYRGVWTFRKTWEFYDSQMPAQGWSKLTEKEEGPVVTQLWAKNRERCQVIMDTGIEEVNISIRLYNDQQKDPSSPIAIRM